MEFSDWLNINEGRLGYILANELGWLLVNEGRKNPAVLRQQTKEKEAKKRNAQKKLFDMGNEEELEVRKRKMQQNIIDPAAKAGKDVACPITPLSGYDRHIRSIQQFAHSNDENFAQTLIFSPLSANTPFAKHWDNFHVLMMILRHYYPGKVTTKEIEHAVDSFGEKYFNLPMTVSSWKLDTIAHVWSNRDKIRNQLDVLASQGDDEKLIRTLTSIPGVKPVKAGFITQLLYGRAGCIDTHNIDIYSKAFPELAPELEKGGATSGSPWQHQNPNISVPSYLNTLAKLKQRGIGTKELWDIWVDFVENFYKLVSLHGLGTYTSMGTAIEDPDRPEFDPLKAVDIPKMGATTGGKIVHVKPIGSAGRGASATHLQQHPDDALTNFIRMYRQGKPGDEASRAIPFRKFATHTTDSKGKRRLADSPVDPDMALGSIPSLLHYFEPTASGDSLEVDPEHVRRIIKNRLQTGGKKAKRTRREKEQGSLF